ncbi:hypothetical protein Pcinc_005083 [Petrolisthes cinctipes]|uniref:Uncharacterized protein n=1 Tax=Petrolisthes cinctipes TaxID=88211 RepID=A0AAE1GEA3_PETCI|nr:hypothetical protein Pcinc_011884 [Petrolisthes cinctipes]KAK3884484.1 hypothetical protein Pcinc_011253 [Petrolisthes cinctipes]KAK3890164.1 hypothetical protein Pcinc_005896 [Petrolisthes cinctipes]KAK3891001.1 hypothetical protein Pcinc_005083 [Petrolisthes cinctipes]
MDQPKARSTGQLTRLSPPHGDPSPPPLHLQTLRPPPSIRPSTVHQHHETVAEVMETGNDRKGRWQGSQVSFNEISKSKVKILSMKQRDSSTND